MSVATDIITVREWVGTHPDDPTLDIAIFEAGSPHRAALTILRTRRADMIANPAKWATADDYSEDRGDNLAAITTLIGRLEGITGDDPTTGLSAFTSTPICGPSMER